MWKLQFYFYFNFIFTFTLKKKISELIYVSKSEALEGSVEDVFIQPI